MNPLDLWYRTVDSEMLLATLSDPEFRKRAIKRIEKERTRRVEEDLFPTFKQTASKPLPSKTSCRDQSRRRRQRRYCLRGAPADGR